MASQEGSIIDGVAQEDPEHVQTGRDNGIADVQVKRDQSHQKVNVWELGGQLLTCQEDAGAEMRILSGGKFEAQGERRCGSWRQLHRSQWDRSVGVQSEDG